MRFACKRELLLADLEIALVDDLRDHVGVVLELEADEIGLAVFEFIDGELLLSRGLDVGEMVIVVDCLDVEGRFVFVLVIERPGARPDSWRGTLRRPVAHAVPRPAPACAQR